MKHLKKDTLTQEVKAKKANKALERLERKEKDMKLKMLRNGKQKVKYIYC